MRRLVALAALVLLVPVSVADDPDPPVMGDVALEATSYGPGDLVNVTVEWTDASGMESVYMYGRGPGDLMLYGGPNPEARYGQGCSDPQQKRVVTVTCIIQLHERTPPGEYVIQQITGQDVIGHTTTHDPQLRFTVASPYNDTSPPRLTGLVAHLDQVELGHGESSTSFPGAFEVTASDETGFRYAGLSFTGPGQNNGLWAQCEHFLEPGRASCTLYAHRDIPAGDYTLQGVSLGDPIGYHAHYMDGEGWNPRPLRPIIGEPPVVHVVSNATDATPPRLEGVTFPDRVHRGEPFDVYLNFSDETGIVDGHLTWQTTRGNAYHYAQFSPGIWHNDDSVPCEGEWGPQASLRCTVSFPSNYPLGLARLLFVYARDDGFNHGHAMPIEWGWGYDNTFADDDLHDVAVILVPRPLEGVVEAIDAVVNEVAPGEVAEIVYRVEDTVDEIELRLENEAGDVIAATCADAPQYILGRSCQVEVPTDAQGVYRLAQTVAQTDAGPQTAAYPQDLPVLAVSAPMPKDAYMAVASAGGGYGPDNDVGQTWLRNQQSPAGPPKAPEEGASTATSTGHEHGGDGTHTATGSATGSEPSDGYDPLWMEAAPPPTPPAPAPVRSHNNLTYQPESVKVDDQAGGSQEPGTAAREDLLEERVSTPGLALPLVAAALGLALQRRRR